ncbi:hypothetical protein HU675_0010695 [Bradyrhizobium septentrionale]|uniref:hypothetical protein n=1 Tax=Bradyrhizobium septentrionale TaxID=1404411 RepID=UPI0015964A9C|nr:hypothetical protein [Bradyrhizobium septentrionale]UGY27178.1 hypothetical protein HU675_0010695 [Bradyrhizobium septentrionale]
MLVRTVGELAMDLPQPFKGQPNAVTAIVRAFQLEHGEAIASARVIEDQAYRVREKREEAAKQLAEMKAAASRGVPLETSHIAKLEREIAEANAEIQGLQPRAEILSATISTNQALLRHLESYAKAHFKGTEAQLGKPVAQPQLTKNETWNEAIEKRRRRIRELRAEADRVRAAPLPSSVVLQREIERINDLAEMGKPDAFDAIERGADLQWPTIAIDESVWGGHGRIKIKTPDAMALIAHLFRDQMIAAAKAAIEAAADDDAALSDVDRAKLIGEAERDALAVEREECALIRAAKAAGQPVLFRPDTDPRAVLGLADDMPAPAAQRR